MNRAARGLALAVGVAVVSVALAAAWSSVVWAEDAEGLIQQGIELRRHGEDQRALDVFERAVALDRTPRALAQLALAEQALGLWARAEKDLRAALAQPTDAWIGSHRKVLDVSMAKIVDHLGTFEVWGEPADADVIADNQRVGTLPHTGAIRAAVGPVSVSVRAPGYLPWSRVLDIKKSEYVKEHVQLTPAPAPQAAATLDSPPHAALALDAARPVDPQPADRPFYTRWWFWTAVGAVAVGGAVSAYALTRKDSSDCQPPNCWQ